MQYFVKGLQYLVGDAMYNILWEGLQYLVGDAMYNILWEGLQY